MLEGITPAYAGTTPPPSSCATPAQDHPRLCGDHYYDAGGASSPEGSPPLMRGPPVLVIVGVMGYGITPAYAGTTRGGQQSGVAATDHPRLCGDHGLIACLGAFVGGSPPLMRGPPPQLRRG